MSTRVQITFRHVLPSDSARKVVAQKFSKLCTRLPPGARCHVVLDRLTARTLRDEQVSARIDISGAGFHLCTVASAGDTCSAIRDAFERAFAQSERDQAAAERRRAVSNRSASRRRLRSTSARSFAAT
jgi:ribosome-associated translation inhibitor RaiA